MVTPLAPSAPDSLATIRTERDSLRESLIDNLELPDLSTLDVLRAAMQAIQAVDLDDLKMESDEDNNHRAVREASKDLEHVTSSVDGALDSARDALLVRPFGTALTMVRIHGIDWDGWNPKAWVDAFAQQGEPFGRQVLPAIVARVRPDDLDRWYDLVSSIPVLHTWNGWLDALRVSHIHQGSTEVHQRLIGRMLADNTLRPRATGPGATVPPPEGDALLTFKEQDLQEQAWKSVIKNAYEERSMRRAVWQHQALGTDQVDWEALLRVMRQKTTESFYQGPDGQGVDPGKVWQILAPLEEILATGALESWLNRPGHWDPVASPAHGTTRDSTQPNGHGTPWYLDAIQQERFTWPMIAAAFEADGHPHVAQRVRDLGEPWELRHTVRETLPQGAPAVRDRARL